MRERNQIDTARKKDLTVEQCIAARKETIKSLKR